MTMDKDTFLERFGHLAQGSNGIKKLRELILQLAVQGKLVEQDENDGLGHELLSRIREKEKTLLESRSMRKNKYEKHSLSTTVEFPSSWIKCDIGELGQIAGGKRLPAGHSFSETKTDFVYIRVTNMKAGSILENDLKYIDQQTRDILSKYTISSSDVYVTIAGTIGETGIVPDFFDGMNLTENAAKLLFFAPENIDKRFVVFQIMSPFIQRQFQEATNKQAQPKLALKRIAATSFLLPPLEEQRRIVAKVDELMALCDELEAAQTAHVELKRDCVASTLHHLTEATEQQDIKANWSIAEGNFNDWFDDLETVKKLRATILQFAVQGKLVEQDPSDEPASILLDRIKADKEAQGEVKMKTKKGKQAA